MFEIRRPRGAPRGSPRLRSGPARTTAPASGGPGLAFAIVQGDTLVHAKGYGVKKVGTTAPVTEHTVFEAASVTKSFTSALVGMAVDEGKLRWDDRVVEIIPQFQMYDPWVTRQSSSKSTWASRGRTQWRAGSSAPSG